MDQGTVSDADRVVRFLVGTARCGDCGSAYSLEDVHVLDHARHNVWELAAVCPGCLSVWLVKAVIRAREMSPGPTDDGEDEGALEGRRRGEMSPEERHRFDAMAPLSADDLIDATSFLLTFDGDFRSYFGREPDGPD